MPPTPLQLQLAQDARSSASAGGASSFGNISKGVNSLVFIGSLILVSAIVWKLNK